MRDTLQARNKIIVDFISEQSLTGEGRMFGTRLRKEELRLGNVASIVSERWASEQINKLVLLTRRRQY